ncbi:MAG: PD40 domain-containing protein [Saprospirales bacterium]|nr:PD40 domain-containing protein [Saprospirales bacterium]
MYSLRNGRAREASRVFPSTDTAHIAHTAFTAGGHFLFITLCKNINASDIRCELWLTVQDIRKRWGDPVRLPEPVNLAGYTTTQPSIGFDTLSQQLNLWFASDRPGGSGGLDIWYMPLDTIWFCPCNVPVNSRKPLRLPRFDEVPVNAGAINTPANEITPFFHEPSRVLYFSSDGRPGFGGYDIFQSKMKQTAFGAPENAGAGLNSSYNDIYFILQPDGKSGFLSSNRPGSLYLDEVNKACCNDIFQVRYPQDPAPEPPLAQVPLPTPRRPVERPLIPVEQLQERDPAPVPELTEFIGLPLYFDNDEPDQRTRRVHTRKSYVETVSVYLERQAEYREQFAAGLSGSKRETAEDLIDDFFEQEVRRGYERLDQLCEVLLGRLQKGETVQVIIKGFTSPRAESDYNLALGKRRISSVRNHFERFENGVLKMYFDTGQLQVLEASFGETTVRSGISDDLRDLRNSVYHPDAARERRVEIVEIREKQ